MNETEALITAEECTLLMVDFQAGLGFGVESSPRQAVINNAIALARTAVTFSVPVVISTSASRVYSGPLLPGLQAVLQGVKAIERRNMNVWEDEAARGAVLATKRKKLIVAGFLTEACVTFPVLCALKGGFEVFVVATPAEASPCPATNWRFGAWNLRARASPAGSQVLLEFQRDWTRHETYEAARAIVEANGGGYGMGLAYARDMIHPA